MSGSAFLAYCLGAYLFGSVSWALILTQLIAGQDLRKVGSGNLGATNAGRVLGRKWGVAIYAIDGLKGVLPVLLPRLLFANPTWSGDDTVLPLAIPAGLAAILGHIFPFYLNFKGGKGVATGSGVVMAIAPLAGLLSFITWYLSLKAFRMVSLASIIAAAFLPVVESIVGRWEGPHAPWRLAFTATVGGLVIVMHRKNIERIARGTEPRTKHRSESRAGSEEEANT